MDNTNECDGSGSGSDESVSSTSNNDQWTTAFNMTDFVFSKEMTPDNVKFVRSTFEKNNGLSFSLIVIAVDGKHIASGKSRIQDIALSNLVNDGPNGGGFYFLTTANGVSRIYYSPDTKNFLIPLDDAVRVCDLGHVNLCEARTYGDKGQLKCGGLTIEELINYEKTGTASVTWGGENVAVVRHPRGTRYSSLFNYRPAGNYVRQRDAPLSKMVDDTINYYCSCQSGLNTAMLTDADNIVRYIMNNFADKISRDPLRPSNIIFLTSRHQYQSQVAFTYMRIMNDYPNLIDSIVLASIVRAKASDLDHTTYNEETSKMLLKDALPSTTLAPILIAFDDSLIKKARANSILRKIVHTYMVKRIMDASNIHSLVFGKYHTPKIYELESIYSNCLPRLRKTFSEWCYDNMLRRDRIFEINQYPTLECFSSFFSYNGEGESIDGIIRDAVMERENCSTKRISDIDSDMKKNLSTPAQVQEAVSLMITKDVKML